MARTLSWGMPHCWWGLVLAAVTLAGVGCASTEERAVLTAADPEVTARQRDRVARLEQRQANRDSALVAVAGQRDRAVEELLALQRVRGRDTAEVFELRYGSDGLGDPAGWRQSGPQATKAPTSTPQTIERFRAAQASGHVELVGAAKPEEVTRGLIDDRVLDALIALSRTHRLQINSLRISHPHAVQDELGTPTDSNHVYGRAADISAVDGMPCKRETARAPYRTLVDNPPPRQQPGPCLTVAYEAAQLTGPTAPEEIIFYWRVPGPTGVSLPNHDDHVHIGFRNYPNVPEADTDTSAPAKPGASADPAQSLEVPTPGPSRTLKVPASTGGDGTSND